jgi:UDP-GlcNAc3NAcA epimerase
VHGPQFIKAATVSRAISSVNVEQTDTRILEVILHTGQHYDENMSSVFFEQMGIPKPAYQLQVANLSHGAMTGRMLEQIEAVILGEKPDWVLVYGDTNSTLAGALAAVKLQVPVAHVEAGLRSANPTMPEEINRVLTDRISSLLLCPTATAVENLAREGFPYSTLPLPKLGLASDTRTIDSDSRFPGQTILNVGDVMFDAVQYYRQRALVEVDLAKWKLTEKAFVLCTLHRQENTDDPSRLISILSALREINKQLPVLLPLHPRTRNRITRLGSGDWLGTLQVVDSLPYLEMQRLQMGAKLILTDSGGVQKEAFFHGVPCVTLRDETEWVETVQSGWNQVVGADACRIRSAAVASLVGETCLPAPGALACYGSGSAAREIVRVLLGLPSLSSHNMK